MLYMQCAILDSSGSSVQICQNPVPREIEISSHGSSVTKSVIKTCK